MEDKSLELLTEEERKLHEEFTQCQNWGEVQEFLKKVKRLNESRENNEIPRLDMTLEEFRKKYHTVSYEEVMEKLNTPKLDLLRDNEDDVKDLRLNSRSAGSDEMARIGFINGVFEVYVWTDDEGSIPHVHVRDAETKGSRFETCVKLETNEYFLHGSFTDTMDDKLMTDFHDFMCSNPRNPYFNSNYEFAIAMWNMNNECVKMEAQLDLEGKVIVPDYGRMKSPDDNFSKTTEYYLL